MEAKGQIIDNTPIYYKDKEARDLLGDETLETEAQTCTGAINELKQSLDVLGNIRFQSAFNANSIDVDFGFAPSTSKGGQILLFNSNQGTVALFKFDVTPSAAVVFGSKTYTVGINGTIMTITPNTTLWGITTLLIDDRQ